MTLQADLWQLIGLLVSFFGFCAGGAALILRLIGKNLDERFASQEKTRAEAQVQLASRLDGIEQVNRDETIQWQRVEREFLKFQADLPLRYVMRDDYIRGQTVIEAKLDGLAGRIENAQLRSMLGGTQ
ncbi:hypothetical protein GNX71_29090 [Variovorax sp. RKNM96]|uniref:hypothetical protein n=1 Tax=unclassified Variovorax TaxID=663243 RepID=UPI00198192F8|nr:hypothetical protein [Variovorax sp. RKNM96]QSI33405.1 hypothetical protein GNX71_29090 [Variovorax sp. RKNM96]